MSTKLEEAISEAEFSMSKVRWNAAFTAGTEEQAWIDRGSEAVYQLWKLDRVKALQIWEKYSFKSAPKGVTPSYVVRRAIEDGIDFE